MKSELKSVYDSIALSYAKEIAKLDNIYVCLFSNLFSNVIEHTSKIKFYKCFYKNPYIRVCDKYYFDNANANNKFIDFDFIDEYILLNTKSTFFNVHPTLNKSYKFSYNYDIIDFIKNEISWIM